MWPAFPTSEYYGGSDAPHVSPAELLASVSEGPLTFLMMDSVGSFRRRLHYRPKPLFAESRPSAG